MNSKKIVLHFPKDRWEKPVVCRLSKYFDLEFNIPEAKGGTYNYRLTRVFSDGRSEKGPWVQGGDAFLDLSAYDIVDKDDAAKAPLRGRTA